MGGCQERNGMLRSIGRVHLGLGCEGELALSNFASFGLRRKLDVIVSKLGA